MVPEVADADLSVLGNADGATMTSPRSAPFEPSTPEGADWRLSSRHEIQAWADAKVGRAGGRTAGANFDTYGQRCGWGGRTTLFDAKVAGSPQAAVPTGLIERRGDPVPLALNA